MISFSTFDEDHKRGIDQRAKKIEYSIYEEQKRQMPFVTWLYLVEARMCYIYGIDITCIVMMMGTLKNYFVFLIV